MISTKIMSRWRRRHWVDEMHKLASIRINERRKKICLEGTKKMQWCENN